MSLSERTEIIRVGEKVCLFRRDTHAVLLVNETAAFIFERTAAGWSPDAIANELCCATGITPETAKLDVSALILQLQTEGLLIDAPSIQVDNAFAPNTATSMTPGKRPADFADAGACITVGLADKQPICIVCDDHELAGLLCAVLDPLRVPSGRRAASRTVTITRQDKTYCVWRDDQLAASALDRAAARRIALQAVAVGLHGPDRVGAILHASSIRLPAGNVILAGSSGSGKTTLMMGLIASGAGYVADDFTLIDRAGAASLPFPIAASTKMGSWTHLHAAFPHLQDQTIHSLGPRKVRYVDPNNIKGVNDVSYGDGAGNDDCPIIALVFPTYVASTGSDNSTPSIAKLGPADAFELLLRSGSEVVGQPRSIKALSELVNTVPAYTMTFDSLDSGVRGVWNIADRPVGV